MENFPQPVNRISSRLATPPALVGAICCAGFACGSAFNRDRSWSTPNPRSPVVRGSPDPARISTEGLPSNRMTETARSTQAARSGDLRRTSVSGIVGRPSWLPPSSEGVAAYRADGASDRGGLLRDAERVCPDCLRKSRSEWGTFAEGVGCRGPNLVGGGSSTRFRTTK
jgi:hypothetical protein